MGALIKEVNNLYFGTYPYWRRPSDDFEEGDDSWRESEQFDKLLLNNLINLKYFINYGYL